MRRRGLIALSLLTVARLGAQQTLDRSKPPVTPAAAPFRFPAWKSMVLNNGLRVVIVENHALPLVSVRAVLDVDSLSDPLGKEGLFALDTAMMREGSTSMTAEQQAAAMALLGNTVSPLRFTTIPGNLERSLELMAGMLVRPTFPQAALDRQKSGFIATQQRQLQSPATIARRAFFARLLGADHPMTRGVVTTEASVSSITREQLDAFHRAFVAPERTTLVFVGDVSAADVRAIATRNFADWAKGGGVRPAIAAVPAPVPTTIYLIDRPTQLQAYVMVGTVGPLRSSDDLAAVDAMMPVLGTTPGSRLQLNLRERHSYMYSGTPAAVVWTRAPMPGLIYGTVPVNAAKADSVLLEWMSELRGIRERPPTDAEMTLARGFLTASLGGQLETNDGVANRITSMLKLGAPINFDDEYVKRVAKVKPVDVVRVARLYVDPARMLIVVTGDRKTLEPLLRAANIAPVVLVDESGKVVP
jgi:zinc protease